MASLVKNLLNHYKEELHQQDQWNQTSKVKLAQKNKHSDCGNSLLDILVHFIVDQDQLPNLSPSVINKIKDKLLEDLKVKHKANIHTIQRMLGMFIRDAFEKYQDFKKLKQECQITIEDYFPQESSIDDDDLESQMHETVCSENIPSSIKDMSNQSQFSFVEVWNGEVEKVEEMHKGIIQYLSRLSSPQSQLNYLCQHFAWRTNFQDAKTTQGQFKVTAVVNFQFKGHREELKESSVYQNKKMGRMFASFKMLKKIYLSFPQLWTTFTAMRTDKSVDMLSSPDPSASFLNQSMVMAQKVDMVKVQKKTAHYQVQLAKYLSEISNFKTEMNLLLQQIPNTFIHPKMQKMQHNSQWKVMGELEYKYKDPNGKTYRQMAVAPNSKKAEEEVAKKLLENMYGQHREIIEIMQMVKIKKGIKS